MLRELNDHEAISAGHFRRAHDASLCHAPPEPRLSFTARGAATRDTLYAPPMAQWPATGRRAHDERFDGRVTAHANAMASARRDAAADIYYSPAVLAARTPPAMAD